MKTRFISILCLFLFFGVPFISPAHGTVSTTTSSTTLQGNNVTSVWSYNFNMISASDAVISILNTTVSPNTTTILTPSQYTISIGATSGTVTYPTVASGAPPMAPGFYITISRIVPIIQTTSLCNQGPTFCAIEKALDYLTYIAQQLSQGNSGTVGTGTIGQLAFYANSTNAITGNNNFTVSGSQLSVGTTGTLGSIKFFATSGSQILQPSSTSAGTLTLPGSTDTLVGRATTDTLTNKTIDGGSNTFTSVPYTALTNTGMTFGGQTVHLAGSATVQGNGAKVQLSTGSPVSGNCAQFDANGNVVDAGGVCTTGGGGGTVTNSTAGQLAWYSSSGTTVVGSANITAVLGALTLGQTSGPIAGSVKMWGSTSGSTVLKPSAAAGTTTLTLPADTDTLVDLAGSQALTNKTIAFASNTLTGVAPLASPTFSGTVTGPDSATWTSGGFTGATLASPVFSGTATGTYTLQNLTTSGTVTLPDAATITISGYAASGVSGGAKGAGTINAAGLYINGAQVSATGGIGGVTMQAFASSGTYTPTAGMKYVVVYGWGAGGSSGSGSGNGNAGGDTSLGSLLVAKGGGAGQGAGTGGPGGAAGSGTGTVLISGQAGGAGTSFTDGGSQVNPTGGYGGGSPNISPSIPTAVGGLAIAGTLPGQGAAGPAAGTTTVGAGGGGGGALSIVTLTAAQIGASQTVTIGAGGTGGGAAGFKGYLYVVEYQ